MNWLDIVIAVALAVSVFGGLRQGLIKAALSLAGLMVGIVLASNFHQEIAGLLTFITNPDIANVAAFIIILMVVMVIANVLAAILKTTAKALLLGWVDRFGGAAFGLLSGAFFAGAMLATVVKFLGTGLITESLLAGVLLDKFPIILALLPSEFDVIRDFFK